MSPTTTPRPFVFVLMPFDEAFDDVYELGIKPACDTSGAHCERVDEQIFRESILQRIYNQIAKADLIIADLTGRNPNVFYETGYAHALGRPVILLTQRVDDIPFDLKHYPHLIYDNKIAKLKSELERHVTWHLEERQKEKPQTSLDQLEFFVNAARVQSGQRVRVRADAGNDGTFHMDFAVALHNASSRIYWGYDEIGFVCPSSVDLEDGTAAEDPQHPPVLLPDDTHLVTFRELPRFLPDAWESIHFRAVVRDAALRSGVPLTIRQFTPTGPKDLQVQLEPEFTSGASDA